jgi:hypothetical protein
MRGHALPIKAADLRARRFDRAFFGRFDRPYHLSLVY